MKLMRYVCLFVMLAAVFPLTAAPAIELSGFLETRMEYVTGDDSKFDPTANLELWFDAKLNDWLSASITLGSSYDDRAFGVSLGGAFLEASKESVSLGIGLFDVPFGIASEWYSAPFNAFAYAPGTTDLFLNEWWGGYGAYAAFKTDQFGLTAYLVDGEIWESTPLLPADNGLAGGFRMTFSPAEAISVGISYAMNAHYTGDKISLLAGDVELALGPLTLTYQYTAMMPKFEFGDREDAWFGQAMFSLEEIAKIPLALGARFDYFSTGLGLGETADDAANAITFQVSYQVEEVLRVGLSFRTSSVYDGSDKLPSEIMLQVMGMF